MNRKAAAYARYSSAHQREASLDDQLRNCRKYIDAQGDVLLDQFVFKDAAISGTSMVGRQGLEDLMKAICVKPPPVDYLVVDDLSRLTRDVGDAFGLFGKLKFAGIGLVGMSDGFNSDTPLAKMNLGMKALMNDLFIEDLRHKTHRGLEGQALKGRVTGKVPFGYRIQPASERPEDGKVAVIHLVEADVVRQIFELAKEGKSLEAIVRTLVARGSPAPNPGKRPSRRLGWSMSSVQALLRNPTYCGRVEWNKRVFVKNPLTGKRVGRPRPRSEWVITENPAQAIITKAQFDEVQGVLAAKARQYTKAKNGRFEGRKPGGVYSESLLSGILKCSLCGTSLTIVGGKIDKRTGERYRQYGCPFSKRHGSAECANKLTISKKKVEAAVIEELKQGLLSPAGIELHVSEFVEEFKKQLAQTSQSEERAKVQAEISAVEQRASRLADLLADGASTTLATKLRDEERRLTELDAQLQRLQPMAGYDPLILGKAMRNGLIRLRESLDGEGADAKPMLKLVVGELKATPKKLSEEFDPKTGKLKEVWAYEISGEALIQNILVPLHGEPGCLSVIAGVGFEPTTFGL